MHEAKKSENLRELRPVKALNALYTDLTGTLFLGRNLAQLFAEFSQLFPSIRDAFSSLLQLLQGVFLLVSFFPVMHFFCCWIVRMGASAEFGHLSMYDAARSPEAFAESHPAPGANQEFPDLSF